MAPTTADLIEALRQPGEAYETLAARLPISLSTVNRWKKESPQDWDGLLEMLEMAGWLRLPGDAEPAPLSPAREKRRTRLLREAQAALARLDEEMG